MGCSNEQAMQACQVLENGACTQAYYRIGTRMFDCLSCTDTASCQQQATAACQ